METQNHLQEILKSNELESETLWFLNTFKNEDSYVWNKYKNDLFADFTVLLPDAIEKINSQEIICLVVLFCDWSLEETMIHGTYQLRIGENLKLHEIENVNAFLIDVLKIAIKCHYKAHEMGELFDLDGLLQERISSWNGHLFIRQEQICQFLESHSIIETSEILNISEKGIRQAMHDYYEREKRIANAKNDYLIDNITKCIAKMDALMEANPNCKMINQHTRFLIEEFLSGGENINTINDLSPVLSNVIYN